MDLGGQKHKNANSQNKLTHEAHIVDSSVELDLEQKPQKTSKIHIKSVVTKKHKNLNNSKKHKNHEKHRSTKAQKQQKRKEKTHEAQIVNSSVDLGGQRRAAFEAKKATQKKRNITNNQRSTADRWSHKKHKNAKKKNTRRKHWTHQWTWVVSGGLCLKQKSPRTKNKNITSNQRSTADHWPHKEHKTRIIKKPNKHKAHMVDSSVDLK